MTIKEVHIKTIRSGDTIKHTDGHVRTVCASDIKKSEFMGVTLFGDSYRLGNLPVQKNR
jgi:hypothetical protein